MKNVITMMAAAAMIFASCSDNEMRVAEEKVEIGFNTSIRNVTRAAYDGTTFNKFRVTALGNGGNFFTDAVVTKNNGGTWTTDHNYFWPDYPLEFYAYAPVDLQPSISQSGKSITDFTPKDKVEEQQDVLAAFNTGNKTDNGESGVDLTFRHQLAQVSVKALNDNAGTYTVEVLGVKLGRVMSKSTMTFPTSSTAYATWSTPTEAKSYGIKYATALTLNATAQNLMGGDDNWLMLPQTLTAWNANAEGTDNGGAYIAVLVRIKDNTGSYVYPKLKEGQTEALYAYSAVPVNTPWIAGHKYVYTLRFFGQNGGAGVIDPDPTNPQDPNDPDIDTDPLPGKNPGDQIVNGTIFFNVNIEDWIQGGENDITIEN